MQAHRRIMAGAIVASQVFAAAQAQAVEKAYRGGAIVQFGTMHEAIGRQQHQGRTTFSELLQQPHFYAVAALEGLRGEATVVDGQLTVTTVDREGCLKPMAVSSGELQATMLVGAYVDSWCEHIVPKDVPAGEFDQYVADMAEKAAIDTRQPFVFTLEGSLFDVRLHVINGGCPIHARMKKIELAADQRPFESTFTSVEGTIVGIFAKDAVGKLTHPATSTHTHLVFTDPASQVKATGHVEQVGISKGSVLRLPKVTP